MLDHATEETILLFTNLFKNLDTFLMTLVSNMKPAHQKAPKETAKEDHQNSNVLNSTHAELVTLSLPSMFLNELIVEDSVLKLIHIPMPL